MVEPKAEVLWQYTGNYLGCFSVVLFCFWKSELFSFESSCVGHREAWVRMTCWLLSSPGFPFYYSGNKGKFLRLAY